MSKAKAMYCDAIPEGTFEKNQSAAQVKQRAIDFKLNFASLDQGTISKECSYQRIRQELWICGRKAVGKKQVIAKILSEHWSGLMLEEGIEELSLAQKGTKRGIWR